MSQEHETGALRGKLRETEAALAAAQRELKETQARLDATLRLQRPGALPLANCTASCTPLVPCTGASTALPADQCAAWQAFWDGAGGKGCGGCS